MISSVEQDTKLKDIPQDTRHLHFVRPTKRKLVEGILRKCRNLKTVSMSKSTAKRMPEKTQALLKKKGVKVEEASRQGRPISVPLNKMQHALEMRKDYQSLREIERVTGISKSTVHYLEKYAERSKLKSGKKVIYLK